MVTTSDREGNQGEPMGLLDRMKILLGSTEPSPPAVKPARNEPCWCGSGRKYKKCHLPGEEEKAAAKKACTVNCGPS